LIWYGKHSAEYVSLGTWVWPRKLIELVLNIIRSLLDVEPPTSFVFTKPAEDSDIPDDLEDQRKGHHRALGAAG